MANITLFKYMGEDIEIEYFTDREGYPFYQISCGNVFIELSHPAANADPFTVNVNDEVDKKYRKEIGNFLAQFVIPLRNKFGQDYSIYLQVD